jgi:hypothetical protein
MNQGYLEPGVYDINQRNGPAGSSILLKKIVVHDEACALFCQADPHIQYESFVIRKDKIKIYFPEGFTRDLFVKMGYVRLPSPPLNIYFGMTQTYMKLFSRLVYPWHFRLTKCKPHSSTSENTGRSIPVESFYHQDNDDKKIYFSRVVTGQFAPGYSYTLIKGDFHEIESEIVGGAHGHRFFYLMCTSSEDTTKNYSFTFTYNPYIKALESTDRFIPPGYSITGYQLQTHEEASRSYANISIMADPPVAPGESFELKTYGRSWIPWKNPKPASLYEAIRYHDLKAIKSFLGNKPGTLHDKNAEGYTPLHFAATYGSVKIVAYLLSQGADINAECSDGFTPLNFARNKAISDLLRQHGEKE